ncbi:2-keto-gluconate dehydrogenase [Methylacidiphilum kamchatkense Kam1]|uniref:2-keto-gluconate dehydrogenase n=1 Tax=Methylacidiphilum kamchatkense Kam1 TaxID=1202785 RepID=A0A0C1UT05_9BACT|nr:GMC family oxidoreductase [Methylacidiphilum kamchatkense]KIE59424.1 2-keto-gluconate dehydrogenase [Methylacidiphilum kamchatkense Kam1]QDQ42589.1 choline dehydrogenase-like flavoprotein [Methylacidiphilum kamchatkense Kam1]
MATTLSNETVDVCVIGTGAGGGNLIRELCLQGVKVVALEAGPRLVPEKDFENDEWAMFLKTAWLDPRETQGEDITGLAAWTCKTVGGTTLHWAGAALRIQPWEFKVKSLYGEIPKANLADWPISYEDLLPYYEKAEKALGVSGRVMPFQPGNTNFLVMKRGAEKLGIQATPGFMAINSIPFDGRPPCDQCGFCFQGCTIKAKWNVLYEAIPKAEQTGNLDLRPQCQAIRIETDSRKKATSVIYADSQGKLHQLKAKVICVACNSIETARLLLNSESSKFPHGLANGSGMVGKNYMRHLTASSYALFPKPVHAYKGITMMGLIDNFAKNEPKRGFVGGFHLETIMLGPAFLSIFLRPGPNTSTSQARALWGEPLKNLMENYTHIAGMWIVGEDLPQLTNGVSLHKEKKDRFGMPIPVITFNDHPNDKRMREYAWKRAREIYEAAGAIEVYDTPPYPATHNLGTCRMGNNPETSVTNSYGQCHEVKNLFISDGSLFPTGACENPTLTISALAIRQAEYIIREMKALRL